MTTEFIVAFVSTTPRTRSCQADEDDILSLILTKSRRRNPFIRNWGLSRRPALAQSDSVEHGEVSENENSNLPVRDDAPQSFSMLPRDVARFLSSAPHGALP